MFNEISTLHNDISSALSVPNHFARCRTCGYPPKLVRVINIFDESRDFIFIADTLQINRRTAYGIIQRYQRTGRRENLPRGGSLSILTPQMQNALITFVEEKPTATLVELSAKLHEKFPNRPMVSRMTVSRFLDGKLVTLKLLRNVPFDWNTEELKQDRKLFMECILPVSSSKSTVYLDECGFNIWTCRSQGRSLRGQRAVRSLCGQRGRNTTVVLAVSEKFGLVHYKIFDGGMTQEIFNYFVMEISALLENEEIVLIFDNAPAHRKPPVMLSEHETKPLPRYSPFLNMTEMAISCLKAHCKRKLSEPSIQVRLSSHQLAAAQGMTLHAHRSSILKGTIESCMWK